MYTQVTKLPEPAELKQRYRLVLKQLKQTFAGRLKTVVLFGSQARGEAYPDSDHDLFVIIEQLPNEPLARQREVRMVLLPILADLPGQINFVAKTPSEVATNLSPLLLDICVDGICLYGDSYFESYRQKAQAALSEAGLHRYEYLNRKMWFFDRLPAGDWELSWEGFDEGG